MVGSIVLLFVGLGALCVLLYNCAVYALPFAIGLWAGFWAMYTGAGIGSVAIGIAAGAMTFVLGQAVLATNRSLLIRWLVLLVFTVPAVIAGYSMVLQVSEFSVPSPVWRHLFAVLGAASVGCTVIARLAIAPVSAPSTNRAPPAAWRRPTGLQKKLLLPERGRFRDGPGACG